MRNFCKLTQSFRKTNAKNTLTFLLIFFSRTINSAQFNQNLIKKSTKICWNEELSLLNSFLNDDAVYNEVFTDKMLPVLKYCDFAFKFAAVSRNHAKNREKLGKNIIFP